MEHLLVSNALPVFYGTILLLRISRLITFAWGLSI